MIKLNREKVKKKKEQLLGCRLPTVFTLVGLKPDAVYAVRCTSLRRFGTSFRSVTGQELQQRSTQVFDYGAVPCTRSTLPPKGGFLIRIDSTRYVTAKPHDGPHIPSDIYNRRRRMSFAKA